MGNLSRNPAPGDLWKKKNEISEQDLAEINNLRFSLTLERNKADGRLEEAIRKARIAIQKNDMNKKAAAFFEIRLALKNRKIAYQLEDSMSRMASAMDFASNIKKYEKLVHLVWSKLHSKPAISFGRLRDNYEKSISLMNRFNGRMERLVLPDIGMAIPSDDMSISDAELERLVRGEVQADDIRVGIKPGQQQGAEVTAAEQATALVNDLESVEKSFASGETLLDDLEKLIGTQQ